MILPLILLCGWARADAPGDALLAAAAAGDTLKVQAELAAGAPLEARTEAGMTPLLLAAFKGRRRAAEVLLQAGADVNARSGDGLTPLGFAALMGEDDIVGLLLAAGADVEAKDKLGQTPLFAAVAWPNAKEGLVRRLIDAGSDVNVRAVPKGATPLHWAASRCSEPLAALLLSHGAAADAANDEGVTPLKQAELSGCPRVAQLLRAARGTAAP